MKIFKIILPVTLFILFIAFTIFHDLSEEKRRQNALESFNLNFQGIVIKKTKLNGQGNGGIIKLRINNNTLKYDGRSNEFYFCIINQGYAELATTYYQQFDLMDSVAINSKQKQIYIYKKNNRVERIPIFMVDNNSPLGMEVRAKHNL